MKVYNKILPTAIVAQFVKIWDINSNYITKYIIFMITKFDIFLRHVILLLSNNLNFMQIFCQFFLAKQKIILSTTSIEI